MGEASTRNSGPIGVNSQRSVLYAQVMSSDPKMAFDEKGNVKEIGLGGSLGKAYLGDVARAALRAMGAHSPPKFSKEPVFDEQTWELECSTDEIYMRISSRHYWGFGLFTKSFLNEIVMEGELSSRSRCAMDIVASLGRNPWEPFRVRAFERATSGSMSSHTSSWEGLISIARESMDEDISRMQDSINSMRGINVDSDILLNSAEESLERAREALSDKNAPAVDRALSRASRDIFRADPMSDTGSLEKELIED